MQILDWIALTIFFLTLIGVSLWAFTRVKQSKDYYLAGGKLPWWISGVSHHVSGYSGVVFTGYAAIAYTTGFTLYIWWAGGIAVAMVLGAYIITPRWVKLRKGLRVQSPTEYLEKRYNLFTQQLIACVGVLIKLLDTGAKWTAIGLLLNGFTGLPVSNGILLASIISMFYVTCGGLWADTINDFIQFIVQVLAGIAMFIFVSMALSKHGTSYFNMWSLLPEEHSNFFNGKFTLGFTVTFFFAIFMSYNGGTWNLATRFLALPNVKAAQKASLLSAFLYLLWPLILFSPLWAAPVLFPDLATPETVYSVMTLKYLPAGFVGLVLASMMAATMSMTASDANAVGSVISRDILPILFPKVKDENGMTPLIIARSATFIFITISVIIALNNQYFGGIIGLIIKWFGALIGPASIPMVLGLVPFFKRCDASAAISSIIGGFIAFIFVNFIISDASYTTTVSSPVITSLTIFILYAVFNKKEPNKEVKKIMEFM